MVKIPTKNENDKKIRLTTIKSISKMMSLLAYNYFSRNCSYINIIYKSVLEVFL